jgi:hypothetical protein
VTAAADERARAEDTPCDRHRQVILSQVQHVGPRGQRDVRAVVHRQQAAVPAAGGREHLEQREFLARLQALLPQLHDVYPGAEDGVQEPRQIAQGPPGVRAQVEPRVRQPRPQITRHRPIQSPHGTCTRPPAPSGQADIR